MKSKSDAMGSDDDESYSAKWNLPHEIEFSYVKDDINAVSDSDKDSASGILIVDPEHEDPSKGRATDESKALSVPDSLPTGLLSLDHYDPPYRRRFFWFMGGVLLLILLVLTFLTVYLVTDRQALRQSHATLQTQVDNLVQEASRVKQAEAQAVAPLSLTAGDGKTADRDSTFVLADNCWLKAELKFGDCLKNAKECWSDFASQTMKAMNKFVVFEEDDHIPPILQKAGAWNNAFSEATLSAVKGGFKLTDSMVDLGKMMDETILTTIKRTRDAVEDASIFSQL